MSESTQARRTAVKVYFAGTDITSQIEKYLLSLTYTDNEEDETDDLQIKLEDRTSIWLQKWLNTAIQAAAENEDTEESDDEEEETETVTQYKVIAESGLTVHSRAGIQYYVYGRLAYGTIIEVAEISNGWANITYSGKNAYVDASYLQVVSSSSSSSSSGSSSSGSWAVGDDVIANGQPQYSSWGVGTPGKAVTNYEGSITRLNLKDGVPYPIHVGSLGWFAESQVTKEGEEDVSTDSEDEASKGLKIQAVIVRENWNGDGNDDCLDCGQFDLDSVTAQGPPATITIKGTSLPYDSTIRQTLKSKSWESYTLSGIANEIASSNGLACMYLSSSNPSYTRVEQYRQSDITFLQTLCQNAGCSLKVSNNIIVVFDQEEYEAKDEIMTIYHGEEGGYSKYKLSTEENDSYASCHVSYTDSDGNVIEATAYASDYDEDDEDNQCLEISQKVESKAEALELAKKQLRLHNKYEYAATLTFPGNTSLVAGVTVKLSGWGAWNGKYIIKQAKHSVSHSGYTTQISLRKVLS